MTIRFETRNFTPASARRVFALLCDLAGWSAFTGWGPVPGIRAARLVNGSTVQLGSRIELTGTDGRVSHETVTAFVPDSLFATAFAFGPPANGILRHATEIVRIEPQPRGTLVLRRFEAQSRHWLAYPLAWLLVKVFLRRAWQRHDLTVARRLESESASDTRCADVGGAHRDNP